jgi:hypothetical protein
MHIVWEACNLQAAAASTLKVRKFITKTIHHLARYIGDIAFRILANFADHHPLILHFLPIFHLPSDPIPSVHQFQISSKLA